MEWSDHTQCKDPHTHISPSELQYLRDILLTLEISVNMSVPTQGMWGFSDFFNTFFFGLLV